MGLWRLYFGGHSIFPVILVGKSQHLLPCSGKLGSDFQTKHKRQVAPAAAVQGDERLPQPFGRQAWPKSLSTAAASLWDFHLALESLDKTWEKRENATVLLEEEAARVESGKPLRVIPGDICDGAYAACSEHHLPVSLLADQVLVAVRFTQPLRFEGTLDLDRFAQQWVGSHALLLAQLAGQKGRWQRQSIGELAKAFFLTGRLCDLKRDLARDRVFFPIADLRQSGVSIDHLHEGVMSDAMRRLLWKQTVRIRDAFARGLAIGNDLAGWQRRAFRKHWLGGLYLLAEIEHRKYDLWTRPFTLSRWRKTQLQLQVLTGKTSFR